MPHLGLRYTTSYLWPHILYIYIYIYYYLYRSSLYISCCLNFVLLLFCYLCTFLFTSCCCNWIWIKFRSLRSPPCLLLRLSCSELFIFPFFLVFCLMHIFLVFLLLLSLVLMLKSFCIPWTFFCGCFFRDTILIKVTKICRTFYFWLNRYLHARGVLFSDCFPIFFFVEKKKIKTEWK